jgi:uncharacterized protein YdaU (DUF1376 family)
MGMAPGKIRRIDFYPDDWLAGTVELTFEECGLYWLICALIYARGGPISLELIKRASPEHGNRVNAVIGRLEKYGKVSREGEEIDQKRCRKELERASRRLGNESEKLRKSSGKAPENVRKSSGKASENEGESNQINGLGPRARTHGRTQQSTINNFPPLTPPRGARSKNRRKEKEPRYGPLRDPVEIAKDLGLRK